jgi:oxygen-independent coproporphyrinogen III oxidase
MFPEIPDDLIARLDVPGPRYTSYPTAPEWRTTFGADAYAKQLAQAGEKWDAPLSLYVHLPFCQEMCAYCGCNVVVAKDRGKADTYIGALAREMDLVAALLGQRRRVSQMHWGGGTPTFLDEGQLELLFASLAARFDFTPDAELAIEIDPVVTSDAQLKLLARLGFNRLSMGVQDFDPDVQRAVRRIQTVEETRSRLQLARDLGFHAVNFDLICGLPLQTAASWTRTMEQVAELRPDRLAVYSFAFVPKARPNQRVLAQYAMPTAKDKLALRRITHDVLGAAGYRSIGMDHFALPTDELSRAQERRALRRNFQGYTVLPASDVVAFGATGISDIGGAYAQNVRPLPRYYGALANGKLATEHGILLDADDLERRRIIESLMCNFWVDLGANHRFKEELVALAPLEHDGLVRTNGSEIEVLPLGQVFVRNVAMVFDAYLRKEPAGRQVFSRTV